MKYLLDSHTFLWWDSDAAHLPPSVRDLLGDRRNTTLLSTASIWEMQIKLQTGRIKLKTPLAEIVQNQITENQFILLAVQLSHVLELEKLPMFHRDPFDQILIAQTRVEEATLITRDPQIAKYPVQVIW